MQNEECASVKISVALCTFNGESYLQQQLQSLLDQTRLPDEVVVGDDGSTDGTMELLGRFAKSAPFPVRITQNQTRLGAAQNFGKSIERCAGEIISFCDQDDIWKPNKLAVNETAFAGNPQPAFVFSDADMCGSNGESLGYRLWSSVGLVGRIHREFDAGREFDVLLRQNVVTGATLSFASRFRSLILPIDKLWMHDGWITLLLSAVGRGKAIDESLIEYRQHASQSIGAARRSLYQQYLNAKKMDRMVFSEQASQFEAALARLQEQTDFDVSAPVIAALKEKIEHCRHRSAIRLGKSSRLTVVPEMLSGRYGQFSLGWKSVAQDLFL